MQPSSAPESKIFLSIMPIYFRPRLIESSQTFNLPIFVRPSSRGFGVLSPIAPASLDRAGVEDLPLKPCSSRLSLIGGPTYCSSPCSTQAGALASARD
ncbi:unnamed protein product [Linum tenue]|uniref:Uncharacterized protein n=1 Tax=Linum tenue TaxID=586396 RepID=A0AAV0JRC3_9ROSI|nr:unnamed protein product [Linum tenue]